MEISEPVPFRLPSNNGQDPVTLELTPAPLTVYNVKVIIANPTVANTITFYNKSGQTQGSFEITQSAQFSLKFTKMSKITFYDPNNYFIYGFVTVVKAESKEEFNRLLSESDISMTPVNNAVIVSPLDADGNVKVDVETSATLPVSGTVTVSGLQEDSSGNLKVDVEAANTTVPVNIENYPEDANGNLKVNIETSSTIPVNGTVIAQKTYTTIANGGTAPANGIAILQLAGTGSIATVQISGAGNTALNLNGGNALASNALYEFAIHVLNGDVITVANATVERIIIVEDA